MYLLLCVCIVLCLIFNVQCTKFGVSQSLIRFVFQSNSLNRNISLSREHLQDSNRNACMHVPSLGLLYIMFVPLEWMHKPFSLPCRRAIKGSGHLVREARQYIAKRTLSNLRHRFHSLLLKAERAFIELSRSTKPSKDWQREVIDVIHVLFFVPFKTEGWTTCSLSFESET